MSYFGPTGLSAWPLEDLRGTSKNRYSSNIPVEDYCRLRATIGPSVHGAAEQNGSKDAEVDCT